VSRRRRMGPESCADTTAGARKSTTSAVAHADVRPVPGACIAPSIVIGPEGLLPITMDLVCPSGNNRPQPTGERAAMIVSRRRIRVDWGHCDPAGIVFYPNYFRWFDACPSGLFESAGLPLPQLYREHGLKGFPLLDARASFSASASFGDDLDADSCVVEWSAKTLKIHHRFLRG